MKHFDPPSDYDIHDREQERRAAKTVSRLKLTEFMRDPIEVSGMMFCADADADVIRRGDETELDVMVDAVYKVHDSREEILILKIDLYALQTDHADLYARIIAEIELRAMEYVNSANEDLWIYDEEDEL